MISTVSILAQLGVVLGALTLEAILLIILEIPKVSQFVKKTKRKLVNKIRHFFWKCFDFKNDFVEK